MKQLGLIPLFAVFILGVSSAPESNWLESAPGVAMEYKVHVDAGKEDCYWQYVHPGATFYVSYQVLKGGDGAIGFAVRRPDNVIVKPYEWKANAEYEESATEHGGYYSVCLDNSFSKFAAKLVNLYMTTFRYDEWEKFSQDLQDLDLSVQNFTHTLSGVDRRIQIMRQFQQLSRGLEARDFNILLSNGSYIQNWSFLGCVVIIISGITQVYFVRKLFDTKSTTKA
uniref:Transmembrane emp24 domain-containing protein 5 n=1 Tax=Caligus rogercresseyi TaxID=217165 RepID=C1BQ04_CALRO|nr:Transmembrane emp24 domain-containing protein 5 precursor [Caligus rogercresseyi]|eukprot:TRINITY_DN4438_c0_g1_i1.p1 TRINITY_DN4438_c0_g1~~TRINITY_DN4438_c0_g1_i1.p1  ORF type:complete len:225 (-),score=57.58 TRINITY_DN4438_c0_g1_i1:630-1304(-)